MNRTASRGTALTISLGLGLFASVVILVWMLIDQFTTNTVAAHNTELFSPHGAVPDPAPLWMLLFALFGVGAVCWGIALRGAVKGAKWVRWFATVSFIVGTGLLLFCFFITEYDFPALASSPLFPLGWRVTCLCMSAYGAVVMLVAWLPTTDRITE
jgi:Na+-driven multidrug efflux pump